MELMSKTTYRNLINGVVFFLICLFAAGGQALAQKAGNNQKIFILEIKDNIDPRMNRYVKKALEEATELNADLVIIEMDTYGGAVNDADDIRTMILEYNTPVYVFINKDAASAGALISLACDSIFMAPGSSIGAATVVTMDGAAAPDKYQSYFRSTMRSTAEAKGRDPRIAEAMVDESIEIEGITEAGKVLTFSTSEAITHGFCEAEVNSIDDILKRSDIQNFTIYRYSPSLTEKIIAIFLNPMVSGLLILIIIGGIYFELQTPGVGFPILAAAIALILYFVPLYLYGLAQYWEIALLIIGGILLLVEFFVLPGFGVAGIAGIALIVTSLTLMMLGNDFFDFTFVPAERISRAIKVTFGGILGAIVVLLVGGVRFTKSTLFKRVALSYSQKSSQGYSSRFVESGMNGKIGEVYSVLRPSGKVIIDGEIYDASTRGEFIDKGQTIVVLDDSGNSLKVKAHTE
jgi:membrane-bound serine protease (ClpP class)